MGWAGIKNGKLLALAEQHFDVFVTVDSNLRHQQPLTGGTLVVVTLLTRDNTIDTLAAFAADLLLRLADAQRGEVIVIGDNTAENR
jgi:hypothetical protein